MPDTDSPLLVAPQYNGAPVQPSVGGCNKIRLAAGSRATPDGAEMTSPSQVDRGRRYDRVINRPDAVPTAGSPLIGMQPPLTFAIAPGPLTGPMSHIP
jgi:hypothetical protein